MATPTNTAWDIPGINLPVGTLYCIGRNYALHAAEMDAPLTPDPIVFIKPPAAYAPSNSTVRLPRFSTNVHHEVELVVVIGSQATDVPREEVWDTIVGVGVGLDLTARDIQRKAKIDGNPWAISKSWIGSAPVSPIVPVEKSGHGPWHLSLLVNGEMRQNASTAAMERSIEQLVSFVAATFSLRPGDAIFTGTPDGVGQIHAGDSVTAQLDRLTELTVRFA